MKMAGSWRTARATLAIAAVTAAISLVVFLFGLEVEAGIRGGVIPARAAGEFTTDIALVPFLLTPFTAALLHWDLVHLLFNLLFLLVCGRVVETIIGWRALLILYAIGAYASAGVHYLVGPDEMVPMVGASGAISAVIGAYALLFGRNKVKIANPRVALWLNALWLAAAWVGLQLLIGLTFQMGDARIAIAAHIGGFLAGLLLAKPLLLLHYRRA